MSISNDYLISVIIPFYNDYDFFEKAVNSVYNQTYQNFEIIIVNDGSSQSSVEKIQIFLKKKDKCKLIHHSSNLGVSAARNTGIQNSLGEYIAFLDSDDEWLPNKLEHQIGLIKKFNIECVHGSYISYNEYGKFKGLSIAKNLSYTQLLKSCDIGLSTALVSKKICKETQFVNISTKEDYIFWLMITKKNKIISGDSEIVTIYRVRKKSLSSSLITKFKNAYIVYNKYERQNFFKTIFSVFTLSVSWLFKQKAMIRDNIYPLKINYIKKLEKISFNNSIILVALNLASLAYIKFLYHHFSKIIFWLDGFSSKFLIDNFVKTPGRDVLNKITIPNKIKNVYLCGNPSSLQINYIKKTLNRKCITIEVPFFDSLKDVININLKFDEESLIIINISSPKQEMLAQTILGNNNGKKLYILCLGGGIAMACGEEKPVPNFLDKLNLEWLWRLRTNTLFRTKRLLETSTIFYLKRISLFYKKFITEELFK